MATTSLSLGEHWETFIKGKIATGRYGTVSEVIRSALRQMEEKDQKMEVLKAHLSVGEKQAVQGLFVDDYSIDGLIDELNNEEN